MIKSEMHPWASSLLDHFRCISEDAADSLHFIANEEFYLALLYRCFSYNNISLLKICNHAFDISGELKSLLKSESLKESTHHIQSIQIIQCCHDQKCLTKLIDILRCITIKTHVLMRLPGTLDSLKTTLDTSLPIWKWLVLTDAVLTPFIDPKVEWVNRDSCLSNEEIVTQIKTWHCKEKEAIQESHETVEPKRNQIPSQYLVISENEANCKELEKNFEQKCSNNPECNFQLQYIQNCFESKNNVADEADRLVMRMTKNVFSTMKGHFIKFVIVNCDVYDYVEYVKMKAKIMRIKPQKVIFLYNHQNEAYLSFLLDVVSKEYLAPPFTASYRSLYRLCGMYSASLYSKVDIEIVRNDKLFTTAEEETKNMKETVLYLPMKSTVDQVGLGMGSSQEESDDLALRHAVQILQENGELDDNGDTIRKNNSNDEIIKESFFEFQTDQEIVK